jgi:hypothetical protein
MSSERKTLAFETARNQVTYLLNRKDLTAQERVDIERALDYLRMLT